MDYKLFDIIGDCYVFGAVMGTILNEHNNDKTLHNSLNLFLRKFTSIVLLQHNQFVGYIGTLLLDDINAQNSSFACRECHFYVDVCVGKGMASCRRSDQN